MNSRKGKRQLEALRVLLSIVKGGDKDVGKLFAPVTANELRKFIQGRSLDANKAESIKFDHVCKVLEQHVRSSAYGFKSLTRTLIEDAFGKGDVRNPETPSWEVMDQSLNTSQMAELTELLPGTFLTYRRGTGSGGEIVVSALRMLPSSETRLRFEIAYPIRGRDGEAETLIFGEVFAAENRFHLNGLDHGSNAPYLLSCDNYLRHRTVNDFTGVALRSTTNAKIFAARVYAIRSQTDWPGMVELCKILTPREFSATVNAGQYDLILKHIDNRIDNKNQYNLLNY